MSPELTRQIRLQHDNRREWATTDTPEHLEEITLAEYEELIEAVDSFFVIENPDFEVASEVGDVGYLCLLYQDQYGEMPDTMQSAWQAAVDTCDATGLQMEDCIGMKSETHSNTMTTPTITDGSTRRLPALLNHSGQTWEEISSFTKHIWISNYDSSSRRRVGNL
jgi:NTP pyrophosphatase (non-canonical NTP hydrolase)